MIKLAVTIEKLLELSRKAPKLRFSQPVTGAPRLSAIPTMAEYSEKILPAVQKMHGKRTAKQVRNVLVNVKEPVIAKPDGWYNSVVDILSMGRGPLSKKVKKALGAHAMGHELIELDQIRKGKLNADYLLKFRHANPSVLLRDHNNVTTLSGPSAKTYRKMITSSFLTKTEPGINFLKKVDPRLKFGDSPRLSRHAIKRLSEVQLKKLKSLKDFE